MNRVGMVKAGNKKSQSGAVLAVGLIILLIMTVLGVSTLHNSVIEEHMNGNLRDNRIAFEAAEAAVREAEAFVESIVSVAAFDGSNGLYGAENDEDDPDGDWDASNSIEYSGTISGVSTKPRYRIKLLGEYGSSAGAINIGRYGELKAQAGVTAFRITVKGTGSSDNSIVVLRTHYGRRISS